MVKALFVLTEVTDYGNENRKLKFEARYDSSILDQTFNKYTPSGSLEMICNNPAANAQMNVGKKYYFDITEVIE